jgi:hypothetical protein
LRASPVLSYDPVFRFTTRVSTLVSTRSLRALHPQPGSPPFHVTCPEGPDELGHLSPHSDPNAPLARLTIRTSAPQGCGTAVTPVVIDQCQQPTILFSRDGNPSSRCTPLRASLRVTVTHGPRRLEPAPVVMSACREICRLAPPRHAFRACFVATRVPGGTLTLDSLSPPPRLVRPPA